MTRREAKMIAEELFHLIRKDCQAAAHEVAVAEHEEYLNIKEAAALLKCSPLTLYKMKERICCYTKIGNQLRFPKSKLLKLLSEGKLRGS